MKLKFSIAAPIMILVMAGCSEPASKQGDIIDNRYRVSANDTIKDVITGRTWQRCSVGQTWTGKTCKGKATPMTWAEAKKLENQEWRLPRHYELDSLIQCKEQSGRNEKLDIRERQRPSDPACRGITETPTINQNAFPKTNESAYWTSETEDYQKRRIIVVHFGSSRSVVRSDIELGFVRLVRRHANDNLRL